MNAEKPFLLIAQGFENTTSARMQLLDSLRDSEYRHEFVKERVRSSVALQVRALRAERVMTQEQLGKTLGMAQTWVSKLENPDYGKMTVATLLRLAEAFDTDLEIKFRPFSETINTLPRQTNLYFRVPSFEDEFGSELEDNEESLAAAPCDFKQTESTNGYLVQQRYQQPREAGFGILGQVPKFQPSSAASMAFSNEPGPLSATG